jgi:uncharacterized Zn finger protein
MRRESARDRGRRLLAEGRLNVRRVDVDQIDATRRGNADLPYSLGWQRGTGWHCSCPAYGHACAHLVALRLVILAEPPTPKEPVQAQGHSRSNRTEPHAPSRERDLQ